MATERLYLCPRCGENVPASQAKKIKTRYYHPSCYDEKIKETIAQQKDKVTERKIREKNNAKVKKIKETKIPDAVPEEIAQARERFYSELRKILHLPEDARIDIKNRVLADYYMKTYDEFTWDGMKNTLIYYYIIQGHEVTEGKDAVSVIPWAYSAANKFIQELENTKIEVRSLEDIYKKKIIKINPGIKSPVPTIDISKLGE